MSEPIILTHNERIDVQIADLLPGSHFRGPENTYFPAIDWKAYGDTFRMIRDKPETDSSRWPIRPIWRRWCELRFGAEPTGHESRDAGRLWAWQSVDAAFRRMSASFEKHGYEPSLISRLERFEVVVESDGTMPLLQGNKRIGLLRAFGPYATDLEVLVTQRHPDWIELKQGIYDIAGQMDMYHPIPHPDFAGWTVSQPCTERLAMIEADAPISAGSRILDLGCHSGWMSREFADRGCVVTGVENDKRACFMALAIQSFRVANGHISSHDIQFIHGQIEDYVEADTSQYSTCLLLSVAMHLFSQLGHARAWALLDSLSRRCDRMYFDIAFGAYQPHLPFTEANMIESIVAHTHFTSGTLLGRTQRENRPFVVFHK